MSTHHIQVTVNGKLHAADVEARLLLVHFLREDLGRGDITSQAIVARNTRARGRFVAGEKMIVAGLEAAEEVFISLDSQPQLEAFVADGRLAYREDIQHGFENAPATLQRLFVGANRGKQMLEV